MAYMKILYRPEIDGLRAISVFAVILYHAKFFLFGNTLFQGGFFGVDIFFLISGYLITNIIIKDVLKKNNFSFIYFYERRIRRIFPALLFVVIISSIIGYFILSPSSLTNFGKSIASLIFFISNIYFWVTGDQYDATSNLLKPLLHTWSLSIEVQYYILFPIFLVAIIKFLKKKFIILIILFFFLSLYSAHVFYTTNTVINYKIFRWNFVFFENFNFYFLSSRIYEFFIGSLLSYLELNKERVASGDIKSYSILNQIFPSLGIVLIFFSFLFINFNKTFYSSLITLIPLAGASLIIYFSKKGQLITKVLSNKVFVFFGLISYSLFLWHYPIFAYLRYVDIFNNSILVKLLAILLTIILSILSYFFIEKPFRNKNVISRKTLTAYILTIIIILLGYIFYILKTEGIKKRFPNTNIFIEKLREDVEESKLNELNKIYENEKSVFLIGDSHAKSLAYHLGEELYKESYNFYNQEVRLYLKNFIQINKGNETIENLFFEKNKKIYDFLQERKNLIVVWHHRWSLWLLEERFNNEEGHTEYQDEQEKHLKFYYQPINVKNTTLSERQKFIIENIKLSANEILEQGHILILVYPVPEIGFNVPVLFDQKYLYSKILNKDFEVPILTVDYNVYKKRNKIIFDALDSIHHHNLYRVYPHESFCNTRIKNRCLANNEEHLFYRDDDHLSLEGSKYIVSKIMKIIKNKDINK